MQNSSETPAFPDAVHVGRPNIGDREEILRLLGDVLDRRWLTNNGPLVQELEQRIARYLGVRHCIAMCNGTVALEIAIRALGLQGEVIVPSYTFVATAHALHWQGITPVFADIDPRTHNLDPDAVERMITPRTTGIIAVHLWGRAANTDALQRVADRHGLKLMYDAAHAFGCSHQGRMIGSFGQAEVFSFHATKFFNTIEGGAVATNDDTLADTMRLMRNFGFRGFDNVIHPGTNGKMTEVCAAAGLVNLRHVPKFLEINRQNYLTYRRCLSTLPGLSLLTYDETEAMNYQYIVIEVDSKAPVTRDEIIGHLHRNNVLARKYFWPGAHRMEPYRSLFPHAGLVLPRTIEVADRVIVLPTGTALSSEQIEKICDLVGQLVR